MLLVHATLAITDFALAVMLAELLGLAMFYRRTGRGIAPRDLLGTLAAGFFLVVALRLALSATKSPAIAITVLLCLTASLGGHAYDLSRRWKA